LLFSYASRKGGKTEMKKKLLFVTYLDERPDEGLSYVIELAKVMNEDLTVFLLRKRVHSTKIDDLMASVAFAEAGEHETAKQMITGRRRDLDGAPERKLLGLFGKCKESGIKVDVFSSREDAMSAIEGFFKHRNGIDIILIGPNIADHGNISQRKLKRLSDAVARPIVTIARQSSA
jgi:hypothetical protein